jgi:uncharacterized membrane protein
MAVDAWRADADRVADQPQALHMTPTLDRDVARLESFSDAVFGFVATLLVVSIDVPNDFRQLLDRLAGFPGFLVGFLVLTLFWARHRAYFRRFGHYDAALLLANAAVLFSLLFFVFPFKWITNLVLSRFAGLDLGDSTPLEIHSYGDVKSLMVLFAGGFTAVFASFMLLYVCAWRHREVLAPDPSTRAVLKFEIRQSALAAGTGALAMALCAWGVGIEKGIPLWLLMLLVPGRWLHKRLSRST